jgi:heme-degrading monooxygenase HmoA
MVTEIADIAVLPERAEEFGAAIAEGLRHVSAAPGFRSARLTRSVETPTRYVLLIEWDDVAAHAVGFRGSPAFGAWRAVVGPFFAGPPHVEHVEDVPLG